jgi:hypothetical protein
MNITATLTLIFFRLIGIAVVALALTMTVAHVFDEEAAPKVPDFHSGEFHSFVRHRTIEDDAFPYVSTPTPQLVD